MIRSETIKELATALAQAQAEMKNAPKSADNPYYGSKYADLASVWDVARPSLTKHGLSVIQLPKTVDGKLFLETVLLHSSGEYISESLAMKPVRQEKGKGFVDADDPQAIGSAVSYARRYGLAAICGVATEDDDGNAASGKKGGEKDADHKPAPVKAPQGEGALDTEDEQAMQDYLYELCKKIADIDGTDWQAILHNITMNRDGKYGKTKTADLPLVMTKKDGTEWSPLKAAVSKAEKLLDEVSGV